jgi:hypothetical protein
VACLTPAQCRVNINLTKPEATLDVIGAIYHTKRTGRIEIASSTCTSPAACPDGSKQTSVLSNPDVEIKRLACKLQSFFRSTDGLQIALPMEDINHLRLLAEQYATIRTGSVKPAQSPSSTYSVCFPMSASFLHRSRSFGFRLSPWASSAFSQWPFENPSIVVMRF